MSTNTKTKTTTKATISALSNPFSTGGGGVDFEHRVQATFLLALLVESFTPLLNSPITSIRFQGKRGGNDVDDVIVESCLNTHSAKLLCQIKHGVSLTKNETFKEVLIAAWSDYNKATFNKQHDRVAQYKHRLDRC